jgi:hypothetical protein
MRMRGYFQDVKRLMEKGVHSDSYARHFACIWPRGAEVPSPGMQRDPIKCEILWQGNPISVVKTFGKNTCSLCNRERMEIIKISRATPNILINSCLEIHRVCAATNPDSIGSTNRNSPVLMIARSVKSCLGGPKPNQKKNSLY